MSAADVTFQPCPICGTPVAQAGWAATSGPPADAGWCEYNDPAPGQSRVWAIHSTARCAFVARGRVLSALTDEDRVWLREHGWNGR